MMTPIPGGFVPTKRVATKPIKQVPCTCGAKAFNDEKSRFQSKVQPASADRNNNTATTANDNNDNSDITKSGDASTLLQPKRSLWRKMLGKGPKCVCQKRAQLEPEPELLQIPSEYNGCKSVLVAGKRVAFTREMQQTLRKSWDPLDPIVEDRCAVCKL